MTSMTLFINNLIYVYHRTTGQNLQSDLSPVSFGVYILLKYYITVSSPLATRLAPLVLGLPPSRCSLPAFIIKFCPVLKPSILVWHYNLLAYPQFLSLSSLPSSLSVPPRYTDNSALSIYWYYYFKIISIIISPYMLSVTAYGVMLILLLVTDLISVYSFTRNCVLVLPVKLFIRALSVSECASLNLSLLSCYILEAYHYYRFISWKLV